MSTIVLNLTLYLDCLPQMDVGFCGKLIMATEIQGVMSDCTSRKLSGLGDLPHEFSGQICLTAPWQISIVTGCEMGELLTLLAGAG